MNPEFSPDSYSDKCSVCGMFQEFTRTLKTIRESYHCGRCDALLREREQARAILSCYAHLRCQSVSDLVKVSRFRKLRVYEPGTTGPFRRLLRKLPYYQQSDCYGEEARGSVPLEIPHQNLESLSFPDEAFDLVITSDILEHVRKPLCAFSEIARVLKPGGYHVFTVPMQEPVPPKTIARVDTSSEVDVPLMPEVFHGNGKGGRSLVYSDFGLDITEQLAKAGFSTHFYRPSTQSEIVNSVITIIARRQATQRSRFGEMVRQFFVKSVR